MRILIAGCGYVGQATAVLFQDAGWQVEGWTASAESAEELSAEPYEVIAVDISKRDQIVTRRDGFDAVIHCASSGGGGLDAYRAIYLQGARNLLDVFRHAIHTAESLLGSAASTDRAALFCSKNFLKAKRSSIASTIISSIKFIATTSPPHCFYS